ncbi:uncharacterized protein SPPG_07990 [Spizellomyces punctatus DAOM BR117]|uniref:Major facilitator superfamily (MFS) profile domain-containing protein n=1 Tax=Spizellomyces punctatus (strain DAOM BR117) TaxID=645134 RepID=A0A0L0H744_SPIPD|nr:uncharacterized protein SPPG_07990 [Spizellomyces punctatus DAOM BR117]KNC96784.1 hypothetical protein SPPG_07990 [Spizellomyces punctatus DAOM BR117]|eukprot:XP_016604824.1 hypothetical protein SPPG_07990 [Spizellomyces punctatus DAOM BR117]
MEPSIQPAHDTESHITDSDITLHSNTIENSVSLKMDLKDDDYSAKRLSKACSESVESLRASVDIEEVDPKDVAAYLSSPPDGGYGWACVLASFMVHVVTIGVQSEYGVFQQAYKDTEEFGSVSNLGIAFVGSLSAAMMGLGGIPTGWLADQYGYNAVCAVGGIIEMVGLLLASLSTEYWHLVLTHGFLMGMGVSVAYYPALSVVSQWFEKRRGIALGIAVSGSGIGGMILAPLTRKLIAQLGWRWSLRITAFIVGAVVLAASAVIRVRYSAPRSGFAGGWKVVKDGVFPRIFAIGLFGSFGYFVPFFFIPSFAASHDLSASSGALLVSLLNGASALGRLAWGFGADTFGHVNTLVMCITMSALSMLVFWPFATNFATLIGFVLVYGAFSGGFVSLLPSVIAQFYGKTGHIATITGMIYSAFFLGNLLGSPIAGAMMDRFTTHPTPDTKHIDFLPSILFGGFMMVTATVFSFSVKFVRSRRLLTRV